MAMLLLFTQVRKCDVFFSVAIYNSSNVFSDIATVLNWKDNSPVIMLTTMPELDGIEWTSCNRRQRNKDKTMTRLTVPQPMAVKYYNWFMGG